MATTGANGLRKASLGRTRPAASATPTSDARSPHTPLSRSVSGLYGSPGSSFRVDEDNLLIFDFGARHLRAGFAGEPAPRCTIAYNPDLWKRVGDHRQWALETDEFPRKRRKTHATWGEEHELWRPALVDFDKGNDLDLGLVEDKVERLIKNCENKYLMLDSRTKRVALVVPSDLPRPLLSLLLKRVFEGLQALTITLLPSSVMTAVSAGVRSALVVDIGWHETSVTALYEYREVLQMRSIRAGKMLSEEFRELLKQELGKNAAEPRDIISFDDVEEVMTRVGWCREKEYRTHDTSLESTLIAIPISGAARQGSLKVPFSCLAEPVEKALFRGDVRSREIDDHDLPLHVLIYTSLLQLPVDVRRMCMSRILVTGGPSSMPGLQRRLMQEVEALVQERAWNIVRNCGSAKQKSRRIPEEQVDIPFPTPLSTERHGMPRASDTQPRSSSPSLSTSSASSVSNVTPHIPAHQQLQESDPIYENLSRVTVKDMLSPPVEGVVRGLKTLGPWAGASLVVNLRIKGVVEIERERFLSHGLMGSASKKDVSVVPERSRQTTGLGVRAQAEEKSSWSLGIWA